MPFIDPDAVAGFRRWIFPVRFLVGKEAREKEERADRLRQIGASLRQSCDDAEQHFLNLGEKLQQLYADTVGLTNGIVTTVRILDRGDGGGMLDELANLVKKALTALEGSRQNAVAKLESISRMAAQIEKLHQLCGDAERIAAYLTVVGFNIRIQSAREERFAQTFSVIASESRSFSQKIVGIVERVQHDTEEIIRGHAGSKAAISQDLVDMQRLGDEARRLVEEAFHRIEKLVAMACRTLSQAEEQSRKVSEQVGEIVMGIQLHDSISQRISHMEEAFADAAALLEPAAGHVAGGASAAERQGTLHAILDVQVGQLEVIIREISTVYHATTRAFAEIRTVIASLQDSIAGFSAGPDHPPSAGGDNGDDTAFAGLKDALGSLGAILGRSSKLLEDISLSSDQASAAAGQLSRYMEQVRKISFETRLIALNAIVNAAHLGEEGQTFEVLANELTVLSRQSDKFVEAVEAIISTITELGGELKFDAATAAITGAEELTAAVLEAESRYSRFEEDAAQAHSQAEALQGAIEAICSELQFLPAFADELNGCLQQLIALRDGFAAWQGQVNPQLVGHSGSLAGRYTMESERVIHQDRLNQPLTDVPAAADHDDAICLFDDDDSGGDAVLWSDAPEHSRDGAERVGNADSVPTGAPNEDDGNESLLETAPPEGERPVGAKTGPDSSAAAAEPVDDAARHRARTAVDEDLGDNVELF